MTVEHVAATFSLLADGDEDRFDRMAEAVFRLQSAQNRVYQRFAAGHEWAGWRNAPFLPIEAFKLAPVVCGDPADVEATFISSGTGYSMRARHHVRDLDIYRRSALQGFRRVYGDSRRRILAHLPGYQDSGEASSLVTMARYLIDELGDEQSGFTLQNPSLLETAVSTSTAITLLGAAFGLLDLLDENPVALPDGSVVIETGGMKTRRREVTREALHTRLSDGFSIPRSAVFSEYGMCELLSQSYTDGGEVFYPPPWVRARVVDPSDPTRPTADGEAGALAIVDLANVHSTSFILTQDRAVMRGAGFEVLGRLTGAELRGCNFLIER